MTDSGVYDRWHKSHPKPGEARCREHDQAPTADHGHGMRWQARWRDETGKQRKLNYARKADAERKVTAVKADMARGVYIDPSAGKVTLRAYAEQWLSGQTFDYSSREAVERRLKTHIYPQLGHIELRALRPSTIQAWLRGRSDELEPSTVRAVYACLASILSAAVDDGAIGKSPCAARSVRPPSVDRVKVVPWPEERVKAVIAALDDRYRAVAIMAAGCGLRRGELFGLAVDDVDFLRGTVHVRRQVKLVGNRRVFAPPKGGKERDVPLPQSIAFLLAAALESCPARQVTLPWKHPAGDHMTVRLIFTNEAGTAIHRSTFDERVWKPALAAAGVIPERRRGQAKYQTAPADGLHALRHYYASALLADGVDIRTLSEYLGHADPGFTLKVYCHLMPSSEDRTRAAIDQVFGAKSAGGARNVPAANE